MCSSPSDDKVQALRQTHTLHPHPEAITDAEFLAHDFFDPRDGLQVKYEMVRRVHIEGASPGEVARAFGFSRPTFYVAYQAFTRQGIAGLAPKRRGPKAARKLTLAIMQLLHVALDADPTLRAPALAAYLAQHAQVRVHPRTIERALSREKKRRRLPPAT